MVLRGKAVGRKVGVQDVSGSDEFAFAARGEWFRQDGITAMVVKDHEVLATVETGDRKTYDPPGLLLPPLPSPIRLL